MKGNSARWRLAPGHRLPIPATDWFWANPSLYLGLIFLPVNWRSESKWIFRFLSASITLTTLRMWEYRASGNYQNSSRWLTEPSHDSGAQTAPTSSPTPFLHTTSQHPTIPSLINPEDAVSKWSLSTLMQIGYQGRICPSRLFPSPLLTPSPNYTVNWNP